MTATTATTASAYVQAHLPILTAYSRSRRFRPWWVDPDDFQADLVHGVLKAHHGFRVVDGASPCPYCDRRGCSTWLGWRARKTASHHKLQRERELVQVSAWAPADAADELPTVQHSAQAMHAHALVSQLLERATPAQREALISRLQEWSGSEVRERLGIGLGGRNYRIATLLTSLNIDN